MPKDPTEIINLYRNGMITGMEACNLLQDVVCDDNVHDIMNGLWNLKHKDYAFRFIEQTLNLLEAAERGEKIMRWSGPDLNDDERKTLILRLSAVAKYVSGE